MRRMPFVVLGAMALASTISVTARQGAQPAPQPAGPPQATPPAATPTAQAPNLRPNQPNFIGQERPAPAMSIPTGFVPLFNGENLAGWHVSPTNHHGYTPDFHVVHGMIVGTQRPFGGGGILLTDRKFRNFELYMEVKPDYGCDSGLFFRSTEWGAAYQVMMDYLPGGSIGGVICEGGMQGCGRAGGAGARAGAPTAAAGQARGAGGRAAGPPVVGGIPLGSTTPNGEAAWMKAWKREDWNAVRIRVVGDVPHVTVWINDQQITDYTDTANHAVDGMVEGPIAIQVHGAARWVPGGYWRWRVIAIKEL